ncbi:MAG TPA: SigE family RNA polymerase sigma factor [Candidatus Janibacter merdipullorum]|nr:SigE family RNA polymerase sigma factor [Candidatus Janibacter merdipullorum]
MTEDDEESFREFALAALPQLRRVAVAQVRDGHRADDLVQMTLEKLYVDWRRINRQARDPFAYARRVLVNTLVSDSRRLRWHREVSVTDAGESARVEDATGQVDLRTDLGAALDALPPRQRLTVVLRFVEDLSVTQTAALMGCSEGTVKSATNAARGTLRELLGEPVTTMKGWDA